MVVIHEAQLIPNSLYDYYQLSMNYKENYAITKARPYDWWSKNGYIDKDGQSSALARIENSDLKEVVPLLYGTFSNSGDLFYLSGCVFLIIDRLRAISLNSLGLSAYDEAQTFINDWFEIAKEEKFERINPYNMFNIVHPNEVGYILPKYPFEELRYVITDKENNVIQDAQGYGFTQRNKANRVIGYWLRTCQFDFNVVESYIKYKIKKSK